MKDQDKGCLRIKKNGEVVEKTFSGWKKSSRKFPEIEHVLGLFKAHKNEKKLVDPNNPPFLKGQLSPDGQPQGARIKILPNGEKLDKAYSLFSKKLTIHDQESDDHWDVLYQNKGGTWAYCYTLKKQQQHLIQKYQKVHRFSKIYKTLLKNTVKALKDYDDHLAVPMYTLLKTHMRIGNEIYYKAHGHKGLTTLKKKDIKIKRNIVIFNYLAKDGVPMVINKKFPAIYITRLTRILHPLKKDQYVFTSSKNSHPLKDQDFKKAFLRYCGREFCPHIVRAYYATNQVELFLKGKKKITKEESEELFISIASELGHKKFLKKKNQWVDNYAVTVNHYILPELVERVKNLTK